MVLLAEIPAQILGPFNKGLQIPAKRVPIAVALIPDFATQVKFWTMQLHSCSFGVTGSGLATAFHAALVAGQARATELVGVYEAIFTPVGVTLAIWLESAEKSGRALTVSPLRLIRPM